MPRMLAISSVASSGMRRWAARRSAPLYDPRRRLPEIPSTLVIAPPDQPRACRAGEGLEGEIDGAEQRKLDELQIAVIARGELGGDAERLGETRLRGGGAAAHQLEDIQVALLRHDRGTGRELFRQRQEAELPSRE